MVGYCVTVVIVSAWPFGYMLVGIACFLRSRFRGAASWQLGHVFPFLRVRQGGLRLLGRAGRFVLEAVRQNSGPLS